MSSGSPSGCQPSDATSNAERQQGAREAQIEGVLATVAAHRAGDYPNFVEQPADASAFFDPDTWERLRRVKALYDPQDVFKGNHHVPPARPAATLRAA